MKPCPISNDLVLIERLGQGATSQVFLAEVLAPTKWGTTGDRVAVKLFRQPLDKLHRERFHREVRVGLATRSPHLAKYYATGTFESITGECPFIVMEYLSGVTLPAALASNSTRAIPEPTVVGWACGIIDALSELHRSGILHRDIQPHNVIIDAVRGAVLMDYGSSKYTDEEQMSATWEEIGTRRFWAPECLNDPAERWTPKTDVFMLGSSLLHVLTGAYLFSEARDYPSFFRRLMAFHEYEHIAEFDRLPAWVGARLKGVLWQMLRPGPADRPELDEAKAILTGEYQPLSDIQDGGEFPLSAFVWRLRDRTELLAACSILGRMATTGTIPLGELMVGLGRHESARSRELLDLLARLIGWGLLKVNDGEPIWLVNPSADEPLLNDGLRLSVTSAGNAVRDVLSTDDCVASTVWEARRSMIESAAKGDAFYRGYKGFDVGRLENKWYIGPTGKAELGLARLALAHGVLPRHPVQGEWRWGRVELYGIPFD